MQLSSAQKAKAEARADFMKRFFAVAVSVGFAAKINGLSFIYQATLPTESELRDALLLILAMSVVVGSWDFYFNSLADRPLIDWQRFVLDISIVSMYIILLISSQHHDAFFLYLCVIVILYFIWDLFCIILFPSVYGATAANLEEVARVIFHGIATRSGRAGEGPVGPFVSLWWLCAFLLVWIASRSALSGFYEIYFAAFLAYVLYRRDQASGWSVRRRLFASLAVLAVLYLSLAVRLASSTFSTAVAWLSMRWSS